MLIDALILRRRRPFLSVCIWLEAGEPENERTKSEQFCSNTNTREYVDLAGWLLTCLGTRPIAPRLFAVCSSRLLVAVVIGLGCTALSGLAAPCSLRRLLLLLDLDSSWVGPLHAQVALINISCAFKTIEYERAHLSVQK